MIHHRPEESQKPLQLALLYCPHCGELVSFPVQAACDPRLSARLDQVEVALSALRHVKASLEEDLP